MAQIEAIGPVVWLLFAILLGGITFLLWVIENRTRWQALIGLGLTVGQLFIWVVVFSMTEGPSWYLLWYFWLGVAILVAVFVLAFRKLLLLVRTK